MAEDSSSETFYRANCHIVTEKSGFVLSVKQSKYFRKFLIVKKKTT